MQRIAVPLLALLASLLGLGAFADSATDSEQEVLALVDLIDLAIKVQDAEALDGLTTPDCQFISSIHRGGELRMTTLSVHRFTEGGWDEPPWTFAFGAPLSASSKNESGQIKLVRIAAAGDDTSQAIRQVLTIVRENGTLQLTNATVLDTRTVPASP